jgi:hypothetical protein
MNSSKNVSEAYNEQHTLGKQEDHVSDTTWKILSAAEKRCGINKDKTQCQSEIAQHRVDQSEFNFVNMHLLNQFSDHFRQLGNLCNAFSELPEKAMMDLKHLY